MSSYIQELILIKLLNSSEGFRYSELTPENVDDNLFHYHLQSLIKKRIVTKKDGVYTLTTKGKAEAQKYDSLGNEKHLFKVEVLPHVIRSGQSGTQILMEKRLKHPYFGDTYPSISGTINFGESIEDAAKNRFKEKTGLDCEFKFAGLFRKIRREASGKIFEDCFYNVCLGKNPTGDLIEQNIFGKHFWLDLNEAKELIAKNATASEKSTLVLGHISNPDSSLFYLSEDIVVDIK